jgi:hypothetical protein
MDLVWPAEPYLDGYVDALKRGWSPNNVRAEASREKLAQICQDRALFLTQQVDREGKGPRVILPDGSTAQRIPGYRRNPLSRYPQRNDG